MRAPVPALAALLAIATHAHAQDRRVGTDSTSPTITVPAGTRLSARLVHAFRSRAEERGETIELQVTEPALLGDTVVVPAGTYAEGRLDGAARHGSVRLRADLRLRLTRLVYPNGYVVAAADPVRGLAHDEGVGTDASPAILALDPGIGLAGVGLGRMSGGARGGVVGGIIGGAVGTAALVVALAATHGVSLDPGTAVDLVLEQPLVLDRRRATAASGATYLIAPPAVPPPALRERSELCFVPGVPGTPDTVIPGSPGTPPMGDIPGTPPSPPTIIPGSPGTPDSWQPCRP